MRFVVAFASLFVAAAPLSAQDAKVTSPTPAALKAIKEKTDKLGQVLTVLRRQGVRDPGLADVEIYREAALKIVANNEFFDAKAADATLDVLDRGFQTRLEERLARLKPLY